MVTHCLYIDKVKSFPINKIVFVTFVLGAWILTWVPSTQPITPGNPPLLWNPRLTTCSSAGDGDTSFTTLETEDFGRPTVSPMGCRKLPLTKKSNATRICSVGDSAWFLFVCRCRWFSRIPVRNSIESRPNRYLLRSSSSEKSSRKISCWGNTFSRILGGIMGIRLAAKYRNCTDLWLEDKNSMSVAMTWR